MSCTKDKERLISRLIDGDLLDEEEKLIKRHVTQCPKCQITYNKFSQLSNLIKINLNNTKIKNFQKKNKLGWLFPLGMVVSLIAFISFMFFSSKTLPEMSLEEALSLYQSQVQSSFYLKKSIKFQSPLLSIKGISDYVTCSSNLEKVAPSSSSYVSLVDYLLQGTQVASSE